MKKESNPPPEFPKPSPLPGPPPTVLIRGWTECAKQTINIGNIANSVLNSNPELVKRYKNGETNCLDVLTDEIASRVHPGIDRAWIRGRLIEVLL